MLDRPDPLLWVQTLMAKCKICISQQKSATYCQDTVLVVTQCHLWQGLGGKNCGDKMLAPMSGRANIVGNPSQYKSPDICQMKVCSYHPPKPMQKKSNTSSAGAQCSIISKHSFLQAEVGREKITEAFMGLLLSLSLSQGSISYIHENINFQITMQISDGRALLQF